jgi:hypothetical protein
LTTENILGSLVGRNRQSLVPEPLGRGTWESDSLQTLCVDLSIFHHSGRGSKGRTSAGGTQNTRVASPCRSFQFPEEAVFRFSLHLMVSYKFCHLGLLFYFRLPSSQFPVLPGYRVLLLQHSHGFVLPTHLNGKKN